MSNEERKLEVIKKAYGIRYRSQKINELGWFIMKKPELDKPRYNGFSDFDVDIVAFAWRPKSLRGVETNNQWIRIEEDGSNLPKENIRCHFIVRGSEEDEFMGCFEYNLFWNKDQAYSLKIVTHYQPIIKPELPLW